ncbi:MAG: bifunctional demethylmenaquinone methyltransferase/2-methoxy-6-polyprenyl-1,4-benzoquinol methylase UbiE [Parachlamydiaceae bacterium]|nr:bifunctional demethylmenaquinone methyltransferase/2-methoxy-6-polyprenyl-1,4-benzoquinol methylase UbiE [Parachlamydiaceae bacterium]
MTLYDKQRPETIQSMFGSIANSYDKTNAVLSFQLHRLWNRKLVNATVKQAKSRSCVVADLCCGTGAITLPWLRIKNAQHTAYLIDFCPEMLECAKDKASTLKLAPFHTIHYIKADVQELPLEVATVDYATLAYGIRNVESPLKCFHEVFRVMKSGGTFGILELTEPDNSVLRFGHHLYLRLLLPVFGKLFAKNGDAYKYLSQSIQTFVKPAELKLLLEEAGFSEVQVRPLSGGIATLFIATKPV